MTDDREGLLTTLRSRRKLYLWLYFIQIAAWLAVVVIYETWYAEPAPAIKHAIDTAVTMSFIAPGVFVTTIFLVDVVIDSIKKGWELMGLLFTPKTAKEILQERGEKIGEARGLKMGEEKGLKVGEERGAARMKAEFAAWYADTRQAMKEGREFDEPPFLGDDGDDRDADKE